MNVMLEREDALALDLLLDRASASAATDEMKFAAPAIGSERLRRVEQVLSVLATLPEPEPPQDLVARTLRFVDRSAAESGAMPQPSLSSLLSSPHPQA